MTSAAGILLLSVTAAAVVVLYLLRPRPTEIEVPSSYLWRRLLAEGKNPSDRWRRLLSLLLSLLLAEALALVLARDVLHGGPAGDAGLPVVVVDNGPSMATRTAGASGGTRLDRAKTLAARRLQDSGREMVLLADTCGQTEAAVRPTAEALRILDQLEPCLAGEVAFPPLPAESPPALLLSDGVAPLDLPAGTSIRSVFSPATNVAVTAFRVARQPGDPGRSVAFAELFNASLEPTRVNFALLSPEHRRELQVELAAGERRGLALDTSELMTAQPQELRARVAAPADALDSDDERIAVLPGVAAIRVTLVTPGNRALETLFALDPAVELFRLPARAASQRLDEIATDVLVFDRTAPPAPPAVPALLIAPPARDWLPPLGPEHRPDEELRAHPDEPPVARHATVAGLALADVAVARARPFAGGAASSAPLETIWERAGVPLLVAFSDRPLVVTTFALEDTSLPRSPLFGVLLRRILDSLRLEGGDAGAADAGVGPFLLDPAATLESAAGVSLAALPWGEGGIVELRAPGHYELVAANGTRKPLLVVPQGAAASAVNASSYREGEERGLRFDRDGDTTSPWRATWPWWVGLVLLLSMLEWWTYHRRLTV